MHDYHLIDNDPEDIADQLARRGGSFIEQCREAQAAHRALQDVRTQLQALQAQRNEASDRIGELKRAMSGGDGALSTHAVDGGDPRHDEVAELHAKVLQMKPQIERLTREEDRLYHQRDRIVELLPNLPHPDTPDGFTEAYNVVARTCGVIPALAAPLDHVALMGDDYDSAIAGWMTGARFATLTGRAAAIERGLGQFMLAMHIQRHKMREVSVPFLVNRKAIYGTGQVPKFEHDVYKTDDHMYLIPTGEVPLTNMVREQTTERDALPMRLTALTPCFRKEAGAAGRDTTGLIRQHQFHKVEMVTLCEPQQADAEFERMVACAEAVLNALGLPYRVINLCCGDLGFSARRTIDLEVWMPSQNRYVEISSISECGDFQTRRMKGRYRQEDGKLGYLTSINGSGLAVGRTLAAVLENHQGPDGEIRMPAVLIPFVQPALDL